MTATAYAPQAAGALATLRRKGVAVTFTQTITGTLDPATETYTGGSTVTVAGYAIRDKAAFKGDPLAYRERGLVQAETVTLLFGPSTPGSLPALGSIIAWNGVNHAVRIVDPIAPDGPAIVATVVVSR